MSYKILLFTSRKVKLGSVDRCAISRLLLLKVKKALPTYPEGYVGSKSA